MKGQGAGLHLKSLRVCLLLVLSLVFINLIGEKNGFGQSGRRAIEKGVDGIAVTSEAAKNFLKGLLENDRVCVMQFSDQVELLQDWVGATDLKQLGKALDWRYHPGLSTSFYDGLYLAAEEQLSKVQGRRIIILLTDGLDTAERRHASIQDALNAVRRADATVYVVALTENLLAQIKGKSVAGGYRKLLDASELLLTKIAEETGGRIFLPAQDEDLSSAYQAIADELRTQYFITYKPKARAFAGEHRRVRVLLTGGNYEVATREGYIGRG